MRTLNQREKILIGLLMVVGVVLLWKAQGSGFGLGESPAIDALAPIEGTPPVVERDLLALGPAGFDANGRDLFKYYTPPPPPKPKREYKPPPAPPPPPKPRSTRPTRQVERGPQPPEPDFKYIGYLGPKDDRIAFFRNNEGMLMAQVGEVLQSDFQLVEFRYETVVLGYTDKRFQDETTELKLESSRR